MKLYFLRHEKTDRKKFGIKDTEFHDLPLTPAGQERADALAVYFDSLELSAVYSSHLQRAVETARHATRNRYEIIIDSRFSEHKAAREEDKKATSSAIDEIIQNPNSADNILIISHNTTLRYILSEMTSINSELNLGCLHILRYNRKPVNGKVWGPEELNFDPRTRDYDASTRD